MGPQDPKDMTRDAARALVGVVGELAALRADAYHWLTGSEYAALRHRLEDGQPLSRRRWWRLGAERG